MATLRRSPHRILATIGRVAALAVLLGGLVIAAVPLRAAPLGGTLTGKVVMKTGGASLPAAPLTVTLLFFNGGLFRATDEAVDFKTATTAPDGSFTFPGLDTTAGSAYRVIVAYKGVQYEPPERDVTDASGATAKTRAVRFENAATTATTEVPIYEPIVADASTTFAVKSQQIIINEIRPSFYNALEALQLTNTGDRTLVGALAPDGSAVGVPVVFTTPPGAVGITTNRTDLLAAADLTGQKLTVPLPIPPGGTDVTVTYSMQGNATSGLLYMRALDYPTPQVQALVSDARQAIVSRTLADGGPLQAPPGTTAAFRRFTLDNAQAGQQIDLMIAPSPAAPPPSAAPQPNFFERLRDRASVPVLLGLAAVALVLLVLVLRLPVQTAGQPTADSRTSAATSGGDSLPEGAEDTAGATPRSPTVRTKAGLVPDREIDEADAEIEAANITEAATPNAHAMDKQ